MDKFCLLNTFFSYKSKGKTIHIKSKDRTAENNISLIVTVAGLGILKRATIG